MTTTLRAASLSLLLAASLAPLVACGGDDDEGDATPTPGPNDDGVPGTTPGGSAPKGAAGNGAFWYLAKEGGRVAMSDLSGKDLWSEDTSESPATTMTIGGGWVWLWMKDGSVRRYDQATHEAKGSFAPPTKAGTAFAYVGGALWLADFDTDIACADGPVGLVRLDPATGNAAPPVKLQQRDAMANCDKVESLVTDGTKLWALIGNYFTLASIDPATGAVLGRLPLGTGGGYGAGSVALGDGTLWVHNTNAKTIIAVDAATLTVKSTTPIPDDYASDAIAATKSQILVKHSSSTLLRIDAADPTKQTVIPDIDPEALVSGKGKAYALTVDGLTPYLLTLDDATGAKAASVELPGIGSYDELLFVP